MSAPPLKAFYLPAVPGERFCIYHPPHGPPRGAVVYAHPFAEEMNKSRRLAAAQARMLAALGYAVVQIDLYGCGDSSGDFGDARWDIWKSDLARAVDWIGSRVTAPVYLWGVRLGAMLALDYAKDNSAADIAGFVLWEPVVSGKSFVRQFLRLDVARSVFGGLGSPGIAALRERAQSDIPIEIAGYELAPQLIQAIEKMEAEHIAPRGEAVYWFALVERPGDEIGIAAQRLISAWRARGIDVQVEAVPGEPFWGALELVDNPALLTATAALLTRAAA